MGLGLLATVLDTVRLTGGAPVVFAPVEVGKTGVGSERVAAGRPCILCIARDSDGTAAVVDGTIAVYGANLPHPDTGGASAVQKFLGSDGSSGRTVFDPTLADMPYAAFSNNNWMVRINGTFLTQGAGAGKFQVSNPSTTQARITLGTAAAANDIVEIFKVTPTQILADGAHANEQSEITSKSVLWVLPSYASSNLSRTLVTVRAA